MYAGECAELVVVDLLKVREVGRDHSEEVVGVAEQPFRSNDVEDGLDGVLECGDGGAGRFPHGDEDERLEAEPDGRRIQRCLVAGDHAGTLEITQPAVTWREGELHSIGKLGEGLPPIALQFRKNLPINGIHS